MIQSLLAAYAANQIIFILVFALIVFIAAYIIVVIDLFRWKEEYYALHDAGVKIADNYDAKIDELEKKSAEYEKYYDDSLLQAENDYEVLRDFYTDSYADLTSGLTLHSFLKKWAAHNISSYVICNTWTEYQEKNQKIDSLSA